MHFFSCSIEYGSNYFGRSLYTKTRNGTEQLKATFRPVPPTKIRNSPLVPLTGSRSLDGLLNRAAESTRAFYKFAYCEYTQFRILVGVHLTLEYGSNYGQRGSCVTPTGLHALSCVTPTDTELCAWCLPKLLVV